MVYTAISSQNPFLGCKPKSHRPSKIPSLLNLRPIICFQNQNPNATVGPTFIVKTNQFLVKEKKKLSVVDEKEKGPPSHQVGGSNIKEMLLLCGFGYWVQGFRCFPWLALNFHMANNLNLHPSTLQLVQHFANLPMVAKPLYGIISDAIYIGDAHRVPYISIGDGLGQFVEGADGAHGVLGPIKGETQKGRDEGASCKPTPLLVYHRRVKHLQKGKE